MLKRMVIKAAAKRRIAAAGLTLIFISLFFLVAANAADFVINGYMGLDSEGLKSLSADPEAAAAFISEKAAKIEHPVAVICVFTLYMLFVGVLKVGYHSACLLCSRGEKVSFSSLFNAFPQFGKAVLLELIKGILISLGFLFFVLPGIILYCGLSMCEFIFFDKPHLSVFGIIGESFKIMRGRKLEYFFFRLSFIGWILLDSLTVVSRIWTAPYTTVSQAIFYDTFYLAGNAGEAV